MMRPIDFVVYDGGSDPGAPVYRLPVALNEDLKILGKDGEYEVLSYYMSESRMILDIQRKSD